MGGPSEFEHGSSRDLYGFGGPEQGVVVLIMIYLLLRFATKGSVLLLSSMMSEKSWECSRDGCYRATKGRVGLSI